jgi:trk system potassium uptake protein TrkH
MSLITLGGIGFVVLRELRVWLFWPRRSECGRPRLSLHTKVVLVTSASLTLGGAMALCVLELNASGGQAWRGSLWPILFCSVTSRTAGFSTIPMAELSNSSLLFIIFLMVVGASPGSTGGGVKNTTFAVLVALLRGRLRGQDQVVMGKRGISPAQVGEAQSLVLATGLVLALAVLLLVSLDYDQQGRERGDLLRYAFEAASAFGTVGLSLDITSTLGPAANVVLILLMFLGRVGPLTFIYVVSTRFASARYRLAEERLMLG